MNIHSLLMKYYQIVNKKIIPIFFLLVLSTCGGDTEISENETSTKASDLQQDIVEESTPTPTSKEETEVSVPDLWGEVDLEPLVFAASDVSQETIDLTLELWKIGSDAWGNYGPLEIWIVGKSIDAVIELDQIWCERRNEIDPKWKEWDCANGDPYNGNGWSPFYSYVDEGSAGVSTFRRDYFDYHFILITMSAKYPGPEEEDYKPVMLHEYFHVVQHTSIKWIEQNGDRTPGALLLDGATEQKPWIAEGGAEYMAQLLYSKQPGVRSGYLKEVMERKTYGISDYLSYGKSLRELSYDDPVDTYGVASWFVAYLVHQTSEEVFRVNFYGDLEALGFEKSFEKHFGKLADEMIVEFNSWIDQPVDTLLEIIP